jgi:excisionase family DNA binding protein
MKTNDSPVYPSVKVLARELGISQALCYRHLADGTIPAIRLGFRYIVSKSAVARWLAEAGGKFPRVMS